MVQFGLVFSIKTCRSRRITGRARAHRQTVLRHLCYLHFCHASSSAGRSPRAWSAATVFTTSGFHQANLPKVFRPTTYGGVPVPVYMSLGRSATTLPFPGCQPAAPFKPGFRASRLVIGSVCCGFLDWLVCGHLRVHPLIGIVNRPDTFITEGHVPFKGGNPRAGLVSVFENLGIPSVSQLSGRRGDTAPRSGVLEGLPHYLSIRVFTLFLVCYFLTYRFLNP